MKKLIVRIRPIFYRMVPKSAVERMKPAGILPHPLTPQAAMITFESWSAIMSEARIQKNNTTIVLPVHHPHTAFSTNL